MKVLVTGGCGFIGSNLVHRLLKDGNDVVVLDDLFLGDRANIPEDVKFVEGSVTDFELLKKLTSDVDVVFHMAARSSAPICDNDPVDATDVNVKGFVNVLECAKINNISRIVYASTSSLYSVFSPPHREDMVVIPRTVYEGSMYCREVYSKVYWQNFDVESVGMRFFSVYGPRENHKGRYANIITQFLWKMKKGEEIIVYGDGNQTRDFIFVDDVVEALILASKAKNVAGEVFNVGRGEEHTFNEVISLLEEHTGLKANVKYVRNPIKNYVARTLADTRKSEKFLGFKAKISLEEGIKKIIDVYL